MDGFEPQRRPAPEFEPPVEPGDGSSSLRGLAAIAAIMRGPAADADGVPPLDTDQVLDLQRSAGNRLTAGALARWIDALPEDTVAQDLLEHLLETGDPAAAAALDALEPRIEIHITGPGEPTSVEVTSPRGGAAFTVTPPATVELSFSAVFGPAAAISRDHALTVAIGERTIELRLPFAEPAGGVSANLR